MQQRTANDGFSRDVPAIRPGPCQALPVPLLTATRNPHSWAMHKRTARRILPVWIAVPNAHQWGLSTSLRGTWRKKGARLDVPAVGLTFGRRRETLLGLSRHPVDRAAAGCMPRLAAAILASAGRMGSPEGIAECAA
jgi:hypothetical protein